MVSVRILPRLFFVPMNSRKTTQKRTLLLVAREKARRRCRRLVIPTEEPVGIDPRGVAHRRAWPMATLVVIALAGCGDSSLRSRGTTPTGGSGGNVDALASGGNADTLASGGSSSGGAGGNGGSVDALASGGSSTGGAGGKGGSVGQPPSSGGSVSNGGTSGGGGTPLVDAPNSHCASGDTSIYNDASLNTLNCDGFIHRVSQGACAPRPPSAYVYPPSGLTDQCRRDTDCTSKANGHCNSGSGSGGGGASGNSCSYDCAIDADCGNYGVCDCTWDQCSPATCRTDADCDAGKLCIQSLTSYNGLGPFAAYHCQTSNDTCTVGFGSCTPGYQCLWSGDHFACAFVPTP
jgi:hypothetical protein